MLTTLLRLIRNLRGPWIATDTNPGYSRLDRANGLKWEPEKVERLWQAVHEDAA